MNKYKEILSNVKVERSRHTHSIKTLATADCRGYVIISDLITDDECITTCYLVNSLIEARVIESKLINGIPF